MQRITLNDGREIALFRLYQRYTYEGVPVGAHTDERNTSLLEEAVAHARARPWLSAGAPVTVIRPKIRRQQAQLTPKFMRHFERMTGSNVSPPFHVPHLPPVICFGCFSSDVIKSRPDELGSRLCVIWFQDAFALPIDPGVEREIQRLEWEGLAAGYQL
jgi:hypothetical protein